MKRLMKLTVTMFGLSVVLVGCLQKDTVSTIYLKQDGSIDWMVLESSVRSDQREEADYLDAVTLDRHPAAQSFRALGGRQVRTSLIRSVRPYAALVEGHFDSLTGVVDRWLTACGIQHEIHQTRDGATTSWVLQVYVQPWLHGDAEPVPIDKDLCDAADALVMHHLDMIPPRITLETGRFTQWTGFKPLGADTVVLDEDAIEAATTNEAIETSGGWLTLSLSWKTEAK